MVVTRINVFVTTLVKVVAVSVLLLSCTPSKTVVTGETSSNPKHQPSLKIQQTFEW